MEKASTPKAQQQAALALAGHYYDTNADVTVQLKYAKQAYKLTQQLPPDKDVFHSLRYYARALRQKGDYEAAFPLFFAALDTFPRFADQLSYKDKTGVLSEIAWAYMLMEKYPLALDYYHQAGNSALKASDSLEYAKVLMNQAQVRSAAGDDKGFLSDMTTAIAIYEHNGKRDAAKHITEYLFSGHDETSLCLFDREALRQIVAEQSVLGKDDLSFFYYLALTHLAACELEAGNTTACYEALDQVTQILPLVEDETYQLTTLRRLVKIAAAIGDSTERKQYEAKLEQLRIRLLEQKEGVLDQELERRLASEKALQAEQRTLRQRTTFLAIVLVCLVLLSAWAVRHTYYYQNRLQQRLLRNQLNPHFLRNTLGVIQYEIMANHPDEAAATVVAMGRLYDSMMQFADRDFIPMAEEIAFLEQYIALQHKRFGDGFAYEVNMDEHIDRVAVRIPPMLIQPILENAIEHGALGKRPGGYIRVDIRPHGQKQVEVVVANNGLPISGGWRPQTSAKAGHALDIIHRRLKALGSSGLMYRRASDSAGDTVAFSFLLS